MLYARALEHGFHVDFDLVDQRPHAPGYILYVATAALARTATGDSNAALVLVSMVASAAAAAALYLFAQRFASRGAALAAAAPTGLAREGGPGELVLAGSREQVLATLGDAVVAALDAGAHGLDVRLEAPKESRG